MKMLALAFTLFYVTRDVLWPYIIKPILYPTAASGAKVEAAVNKADAAVSNQLNFQTPATAIMEKIVDLHHDLMFFIIAIVVFVS